MCRDLCRWEVRGTSGMVTDDSEAFRLDNLECELVAGACISLPLRLKRADWKTKLSKRNNRRNSLNLICTEFIYACNFDLFSILINFWTL